jgi:hypothetical protein
MPKPGIDADNPDRPETEHFMKCPGCGEWFDMRELGEVVKHVHEADFDISSIEDGSNNEPA